MKQKFRSLFYLFFPLFGGSIVGLGIKNFMNYQMLRQPPLAPNKIIFPIAWSILYVLMGIAYYLYRKNHDDFKVVLLYYIQLIVNFLWPVLFFVFSWRLFSFFWIVMLIFLVILLMLFFYQQERKSFFLLIPYLLWLFFAAYLNLGIYLLN